MPRRFVSVVHYMFRKPIHILDKMFPISEISSLVSAWSWVNDAIKFELQSDKGHVGCCRVMMRVLGRHFSAEICRQKAISHRERRHRFEFLKVWNRRREERVWCLFNADYTPMRDISISTVRGDNPIGTYQTQLSPTSMVQNILWGCTGCSALDMADERLGMYS